MGQLFREWDVALFDAQLGGLRTDEKHTLTTYVNGNPVAGNPATIRLAIHQEIVIVYGSVVAARVLVAADRVHLLSGWWKRSPTCVGR